MSITYNKEDLVKVTKLSKSRKEILQNLNIRAAGGNYQTLNKYIKQWNIDISHFPTQSERSKGNSFTAIPLDLILVKNSSYNNRTNLKQKLYKAKIKTPICELCNQGELWNDKKMSLILDHKNGVFNDNRLENLRIVCPNCNATLETHCGKHKSYSSVKRKRVCPCGNNLNTGNKYCSHPCYIKFGSSVPRYSLRKVERPNREIFFKELETNTKTALAKKYGVSEQAIRKWIKAYKKLFPEEASPLTN